MENRILDPVPTTPASRQGSLTVLVVDDNEHARNLCCRLVQMRGDNPLEAQSATEALLVCEIHEGPIDLVVCDIEMPGQSGPELVRRMIALRPETRVLFITGYTTQSEALHGISGRYPVLPKPFTPTEFNAQVDQVMGFDAPDDEA